MGEPVALAAGLALGLPPARLPLAVPEGEKVTVEVREAVGVVLPTPPTPPPSVPLAWTLRLGLALEAGEAES